MKFPGADLPPNPTKAQRAARDAEFKAWCATEAERIRRQRIYLTTQRGPLRDGLVARMLERARELLDCGECEAADALLEFCPEPDATALLDEVFAEVENAA